MMLGHVQAVKPGRIGGRNEFEPFVELGRECPVRRPFKVVE
jgi:hypothetical protein